MVSVLKSMYSPSHIFSKMHGVTGGRDGLWIPVAVGDAVKLVPWTVIGGLITCRELGRGGCRMSVIAAGNSRLSQC